MKMKLFLLCLKCTALIYRTNRRVRQKMLFHMEVQFQYPSGFNPSDVLWVEIYRIIVDALNTCSFMCVQLSRKKSARVDSDTGINPINHRHKSERILLSLWEISSLTTATLLENTDFIQWKDYINNVLLLHLYCALPIWRHISPKSIMWVQS